MYLSLHLKNKNKLFILLQEVGQITMTDNIQVPNEFSDAPSKAEGGWWRHSLAGGVAGVISRTSTAPIDRIKLYMQV